MSDKVLYKYFGSGACEMANVTFRGFGSKGELDDQQALDAIDAGAGIITAVQFDSLFLAEDAVARNRAAPTSTFLVRNATALEYRDMLRQFLIEKLTPAPPEPEKIVWDPTPAVDEQHTEENEE